MDSRIVNDARVDLLHVGKNHRISIDDKPIKKKFYPIIYRVVGNMITF